MSIKINKQTYRKLIEEDLKYLNEHCEEGSPEKDHIRVVLCSSIDYLYPQKRCKSHESCCFVKDDLKEGEFCQPTKGCFT